MDHIIALYNVAPQPALKMTGPPVGYLEYGIGVRKEDTELLRDINRALAALIASGELRRILEKWNLWTAMNAEHFGGQTPWSGGAAAMYFLIGLPFVRLARHAERVFTPDRPGRFPLGKAGRALEAPA